MRQQVAVLRGATVAINAGSQPGRALVKMVRCVLPAEDDRDADETGHEDDSPLPHRRHKSDEQRTRFHRFLGAAARSGGACTRTRCGGYLISVNSLNIGRYIEITMVPTMAPTQIISSGSMIDVKEAILASTSSS
jgi:hypothetical protein